MLLRLHGLVLSVGSPILHAFARVLCALCPYLCLPKLMRHGHRLVGNDISRAPSLSFFGVFVT